MQIQWLTVDIIKYLVATAYVLKPKIELETSLLCNNIPCILPCYILCITTLYSSTLVIILNEA